MNKEIQGYCKPDSLLKNVFKEFETLLTYPSLVSTPLDSGLMLFGGFNTDYYTDDSGLITLSIEVPGLDENKISVELEEDKRVLVVTLSHQYESKKNPDFVVRERRTAACKRAFRLPVTADLSTIKAEIENGLLVITMNSREVEDQKPLSRKIEISKRPLH